MGSTRAADGDVVPLPVRGDPADQDRQLTARRRLGGILLGMRFLWASLAMLPFAAVAVGMVTGRVRVRSCCSVPPERDARIRAAVTSDTDSRALPTAQRWARCAGFRSSRRSS